MKLDLKRLMQSMPNGKQVDDPEDPRLKRVNAVLAKQGLYYDPKRRKVMQIELAGSMKGGPMKGAMVVPQEAMMDYLRKEGFYDMGTQIPTKRANLSDLELRKRGFKRDPKSGDIFPLL